MIVRFKLEIINILPLMIVSFRSDEIDPLVRAVTEEAVDVHEDEDWWELLLNMLLEPLDVLFLLLPGEL